MWSLKVAVAYIERQRVIKAIQSDFITILGFTVLRQPWPFSDKIVHFILCKVGELGN